MRIGIYGGTFDPIHFAHLHAIAYAFENAKLDLCRVIGARDPWQKPEVKADAQKRFRWTQLGVEEFFPDNKNIIVDDCEIKRDGNTYTIDTINELKHKYPNDDLVLIVGDDIPENFNTWKDHDQIIKLCELFIVSKSIMPISSTYIRKQLLEGKTVRALIPKSIENDIILNNFYT